MLVCAAQYGPQPPPLQHTYIAAYMCTRMAYACCAHMERACVSCVNSQSLRRASFSSALCCDVAGARALLILPLPWLLLVLAFFALPPPSSPPPQSLVLVFCCCRVLHLCIFFGKSLELVVSKQLNGSTHVHANNSFTLLHFAFSANVLCVIVYI